MDTSWRFPVMIAVSAVVFAVILAATLRPGEFRRRRPVVLLVVAIVVIGGMSLGRYGAQLGLPWWIYYPVPAALTWLLPPLAFRMRGRRLVAYLVLALVSAPVIHFAFAFLFGWGEYLPFLPVPSFASLVN